MKLLILHTVPPDEAPAGRISNEFNLSAAAIEVARCVPQSGAKTSIRRANPPAPSMHLVS